MAPSPIPADIVRLLTVAIESIDRLHILLVMHRERPKSFTARTLRSALSDGSSNALDNHLAILCGRGFLAVTIGNDLVYTYKPISQRIEDQIAALAELWDERRSDVVAILENGGSDDPVRVFADAFRFRKKDGDG